MIKHIPSLTDRLLAVMVAAVLLIVATPMTARADVSSDLKSILNQTTFYDPYYTAQCTQSSTVSTTASTINTNVDAWGKPIFNEAQLAAINQNKAIYEEAAKAVDIPWQMIAVIHIRESGGGRENPGNGQGIYQFVNRQGGPYPTGPVTEQEFARQTKFAAEFIKGKASSNYAANKSLTASATPEAVKDTFFSYNGRSDKYESQAVKLGYSADQGYEGSPYVMNKADIARNRDTAPAGTWGQIKRDFGPIEYPANGDYGAFVMYAALSGISLSGSCSNGVSGPLRERVVALARVELELWESGKMTNNGRDFEKYTHGVRDNWCAFFVSWIYNQAGYSMSPNSRNGAVGPVSGLKSIGEQNDRFTYHDAAGYTPVPGDIVIQKNGKSHTNIVVAVDGNKITVIGGNQGYAQAGVNNFSNSKVTQYDIIGSTSDGTSGYVSPVATE